MKGKITLLAGAAVGYVLGTRAGRERYDEIVSKATSLWESPQVQAKAQQATDLAKDKGPAVQKKVTDAAASATEAAKSKVSSGSKHEKPVAEPVLVVDPVDPADPTTTTQTPYPTSATTGLA